MIADFNHLAEEYIKCISNKTRIYMIEHYLKTYDATQKRQVPYLLFPRQKYLCEVLGNANNVVCTKPRQAGITTTCGAFVSCEMVLADEESPLTVLIIGNTLDLSMQMLDKIRGFLLQFPAWLWGDRFADGLHDLMKPPSKKDIFAICNSKELVLNNGCRVVARSSGPDASRGVGGVSWLIFDEAAFIENGNDVYASAIPTISTGGHTVMISTPNGKDRLYYETCRLAALKGTKDWNNFELVEMRWEHDPRYNKFLEWTRKNTETGGYDIIKEDYINEQGDVRYDPDRWAKLKAEGWSPRSPWYVKMCQQFNNDAQKIAQELDVSFLGSDSTVVAPEFIKMQTELNVREPSTEYKDPVLDDLWIWKPPYEGHQYLLCVDNSRGSSDDFTALEIIDMTGFDNGEPCVEQVLEYNGKLTGDAIGEIAYKYGKLYNEAFIVVEDIGGYGSATLLTLMAMKYKRLYYDDPDLKNFTSQNDATSTPETEEGLPGFHSTSVRYQMLSSFANLVKTNQFKIRSKRVISELDTWVFKNGRIDHKDGCHDDTLTCLAMGLFVMQFSLNKQTRAKTMNTVMLRSMIAVNSDSIRNNNPKPVTVDEEGKIVKKPKPILPVVINNYNYGGGNGAANYRAYLWVVK